MRRLVLAALGILGPAAALCLLGQEFIRTWSAFPTAPTTSLSVVIRTVQTIQTNPLLTSFFLLVCFISIVMIPFLAHWRKFSPNMDAPEPPPYNL